MALRSQKIIKSDKASSECEAYFLINDEYTVWALVFGIPKSGRPWYLKEFLSLFLNCPTAIEAPMPNMAAIMLVKVTNGESFVDHCNYIVKTACESLGVCLHCVL
jgi:hypothetical protein